MTKTYKIADVTPYINWVYYYFAWQVRQEEEQQRLKREALDFLQKMEGRYRTHAVWHIVGARGDGDDIVTDDGFRLPMLRQQTGVPTLCLADFVNPAGDKIGLFATSADHGLETDFNSDPYAKMMAQLLADRLAEATAERMHEEVRKHYWGYVPNEKLSIRDLHMEHFQGIRPAVGYPSLPDASLNFLLNDLLHMNKIGITLTENGAMRPHASVSGLMLAHPQAHYFSIGKIGDDQLADYARRRNLPIEQIKKFLTANL
jgi:cobalamin-dependent methionine synthase I